MKILQLGNKKLEKKSKPVKKIKSRANQNLIDNLLKICYKNEKSTGGLAAPQLGKNIRMFIARRVDIEEKYRKKKKDISQKESKKLWEVIINPKIKKTALKKATYWEGCLSIEHGKVFGPVKRPSLIKIEYFNRKGERKKIVATDFFSHLIQHEIDHLKGILFVKYIKNPKNLWNEKTLDKYLRKHGDFPEIVD